MKHALFYKYIKLNNLEELQEQLHALLLTHHAKGTILLGDEGINGAFTAEEQDMNNILAFFKADERFHDIDFKMSDVDDHTFRKTKVKFRNEIVSLRLDHDVDMKNSAPYVEPEQLKQWIEEYGDDLVIIDARNDYESKIGRFKNAILPDIKTFREWPEAVKELEHLKDKKIVTYCTGGIRCEKASAYMKEQGFKDVHQLHGGIVRYGQSVGDEHWEGKCFVFDDRLAVDIDPSKESPDITTCDYTGVPCTDYHNCTNTSCDALFIATKEATAEHDGLCPKCSAQEEYSTDSLHINTKTMS